MQDWYVVIITSINSLTNSVSRFFRITIQGIRIAQAEMAEIRRHHLEIYEYPQTVTLLSREIIKGGNMSILYNLLHKISLLVFSCFYLVVWFYSAILHETQRNPNALPPKHYYLYVAIIILLFTLFFLIDFVIIKKVYICFSVLRIVWLSILLIVAILILGMYGSLVGEFVFSKLVISMQIIYIIECIILLCTSIFISKKE